ncbi:MAG: ABC transporter ATP-binding protein [Eubacterium sp.]|nr:ABC transporter ATP-binding protein [Eubacterium sp.]
MKITLKNVSAGYDKKNFILKDISTTFEEGGICGILGPNGSGKTTLLRVLSGTLPYKGSIELYSNGAEKTAELDTLSRKELARYIAVSPQISSVYFSYSIYETVMMGRYAHSTSFLDSLRNTSSKDRDTVEQALEMTGLSDISDKQLSELSGGQLQRVLLARTIAQETPIILLDEPTNHLDPKYHIELMDHLKKWSSGTTEIDGVSHKNTVISVFHDLGAALMISDDILFIKDGFIIKKGPVQETLTQDLLNDIYETDVFAYYSAILEKTRSII